jgi:hypothetical protein
MPPDSRRAVPASYSSTALPEEHNPVEQKLEPSDRTRNRALRVSVGALRFEVSGAAATVALAHLDLDYLRRVLRGAA